MKDRDKMIERVVLTNSEQELMQWYVFGQTISNIAENKLEKLKVKKWAKLDKEDHNG